MKVTIGKDKLDMAQKAADAAAEKIEAEKAVDAKKPEAKPAVQKPADRK